MEKSFSELFARSTDVYSAITTVMIASKSHNRSIDPNDVVRELMTHYPDVSLSPAEILEQVVRAAAEAGVLLNVRVPHGF